MNRLKLLTLPTIIICFIILSSSAAVAGDSLLSFKNGSLNCIDLEKKDTLHINDCMSFDLIKIGDSHKSVTALLGDPDRLIAGIDTAQIEIYPLTPANLGDDPYLLVTVRDEIVTTLMLQGRGTTDQFSFSGLQLGDSSSVVISKLGPASAVYPNKNSGSELWQYEPNPFSFEMEKGKLVSIQIWHQTIPKETKTK